MVIHSSDGRRQFIQMSYMPGMQDFAEEENSDRSLSERPVCQPDHAHVRRRGHRQRCPRPPVPRCRSSRHDGAGYGSAPAELPVVDGRRRAAAGARRVPPPHRNVDRRRQRRSTHRPVSLHDRCRRPWIGAAAAITTTAAAREYTWWIQQKLTDIFYSLGTYVPMFAYERSVTYPEGHRNVVFAQRGIRPLPRLPKMADETPVATRPTRRCCTRYLRQFSGIVASHTCGTEHGHGLARQRSGVRTGGGDLPGRPAELRDARTRRAPITRRIRSAAGGRWASCRWRCRRATAGFQASSDHISTHMSYCNLLVTTPPARRDGGVPQAARLRRDGQHPGRRALRATTSWARSSRTSAPPSFR